MRLIRAKLSAVRETTLREQVVRFVLGGLVTVAAGLIAKGFGPVWGGLFLAFPAIFPASATLIESHERKKRSGGQERTLRGREAASLDALGSAIGSIGLFAFAMVLWKFLPRHNAPGIIALASAAWLLTSAFFWYVRKQRA